MTRPVIGLADGSRVVVTSGHPAPEEAAALVVALDTVLRAERDARPEPATLPAWQRAAYLEGVGGPSISSPAGLTR